MGCAGVLRTLAAPLRKPTEWRPDPSTQVRRVALLPLVCDGCHTGRHHPSRSLWEGCAMTSHRSKQRGPGRMLGILAVACTTVVATASAASGTPQVAAQSASSGATTEYVVAYSGSEQAATAAIQAAGGSVKDVTAQVGLALVTSTDGAFMDKVRTRAEIRGAAKNHSVGTSRLGMPPRFAGGGAAPAGSAQSPA